jgi:hypothetical protein
MTKVKYILNIEMGRKLACFLSIMSKYVIEI